MAPFLVILLLLALGAGIIAWHTIGYPHAPAPRRPASPKPTPPEPDAPQAAVSEPVFAPTSTPLTAPVVRADDPFAHAPPLDPEPRS
ncbi:hypothetical protein BH09PSE1_BH09PSE1_20880 [soil metagenome]